MEIAGVGTDRTGQDRTGHDWTGQNWLFDWSEHVRE